MTVAVVYFAGVFVVFFVAGFRRVEPAPETALIALGWPLFLTAYGAERAGEWAGRVFGRGGK